MIKMNLNHCRLVHANNARKKINGIITEYRIGSINRRRIKTLSSAIPTETTNCRNNFYRSRHRKLNNDRFVDRALTYHYLKNSSYLPCTIQQQWRSFGHAEYSTIHNKIALDEEEMKQTLHDLISMLSPSSQTKSKRKARTPQYSMNDDEFWKQMEMVLQWLISADNNNNNNNNENKAKNIVTCIQLLDLSSNRLPQIQDMNSPAIFSSFFPTQRKENSFIVSTDINDKTMNGFISNKLFNELLKQWKVTQQAEEQTRYSQLKRSQRLPSPSTMAEKVEKYRWTDIIQPNAVTYTILLQTMIQIEGIQNADSYLQRLLQVSALQQQQQQQLQQNSDRMIDIVSIGIIMQGWVGAKQPEKAQIWFDRLQWKNVNGNNNKIDFHNENKVDLLGEYCSNLNLRPGTVVYMILVHGWAKQGNACKAQHILQQLIEEYQNHHKAELKPDRMIFHAVLDAWSKVKSPKEKDKIAPNQVKVLIEQMQTLAGNTNDDFSRGDDGNNYIESRLDLQPNMETWCKALIVFAQSSSKQYGPDVAEEMLWEIEDELGELAPVVVINRILQAYTTFKRSDEAEDFLQRRIEFLTSLPEVPDKALPDEITFNILMSGFAAVAKKESDATFRAESWLCRMLESGISPTIHTYSIMLNVLSQSVSHLDDAAERAETLLRQKVIPLYENGDEDAIPNTSKSSDISAHLRSYHRMFCEGDGLTICYNIVMKAWANQATYFHQQKKDAEKSSYAAHRSIRLLYDFLQYSEHENTRSNRQHRLKLNYAKPPASTFRAVLHAITGSSIPQKHEKVTVIMDLMRKHGIRPNKQDSKLIERLSKVQSRRRKVQDNY